MRDGDSGGSGIYLKAPHEHIRQKLNVQLYVKVVGMRPFLPAREQCGSPPQPHNSTCYAKTKNVFKVGAHMQRQERIYKPEGLRVS